MPGVKVQLSRFTDLNSRFKSLEFIKKTIDARIAKTEKAVRDVVLKLFIDEIRSSNVFRGLVNPSIGVRGYDLPAEFGLEPGEGERLARLLLSTLLDTIHIDIWQKSVIRRIGNRPGVEVGITIKALNPREYEPVLTSPPFVYTSNDKYAIEWMKWILEAHRGTRAAVGITPSLKNYGITYSMSPKQRAKSRSGRAVMVKDGKRNRKKLEAKYFPYSMPEIVIPRAGADNFIDEIIKDRTFISILEEKVISAVERYLVSGG